MSVRKAAGGGSARGVAEVALAGAAILDELEVRVRPVAALAEEVGS